MNCKITIETSILIFIYIIIVVNHCYLFELRTTTTALFFTMVPSLPRLKVRNQKIRTTLYGNSTGEKRMIFKALNIRSLQHAMHTDPTSLDRPATSIESNPQ